jgi:hypothetical protein
LTNILDNLHCCSDHYTKTIRALQNRLPHFKHTALVVKTLGMVVVELLLMSAEEVETLGDV